MIKQTLEDAFSLHQQGRLEEARFIYQAILEKNPDHFDVLHLSALAAHALGRLTEAELFFKKAIAVDTAMSQA